MTDSGPCTGGRFGLDHKWGRNIELEGLGCLGATMCSGRLLFPRLILTNASAGASGFWGWNQAFPDAGFAYFPFTYHYLAGHPHFPGGHDVDPDGPV